MTRLRAIALPAAPEGYTSGPPTQRPGGALPFWQQLRGNRSVRAALAGVNAAVVGLLPAALYDPVAVAGITSVRAAALALAAFALLWRRVAPWLVVILSAIASGLLSGLALG
jgi:chromate transporter